MPTEKRNPAQTAHESIISESVDLAAKQIELEETNSSLEARIEELIAELHRKDDILIQQSRLNTMGEMIGTIAHQWRQPLNNIGLIVQSLQIAYKANDLSVEEIDQNVADTLLVVQSISETIEDFLNFFCREDVSSSFSINELFLHSLSFVVPSLRRKGIRIEIDEEPDVMAEGYPNQYAQAVLNLILNARDVLLDRQVVQPLIKIRICRENGHSVVTVSDNGGGIQEDILTRIFEPFFTTRVQEKAAGIGLFIAKTIIEKKMHGNLSALNVDGGAEFRIEV